VTSAIKPSSTDKIEYSYWMQRRIINADVERQEHLSKAIRIGKKDFKRRTKAR
jgi:hypothetical protein